MKIFGVSVTLIVFVLVAYLVGVKFPSAGKKALSYVGM